MQVAYGPPVGFLFVGYLMSLSVTGVDGVDG
jgi:hypothetical protein